jgi:hypothetical protein
MKNTTVFTKIIKGYTCWVEHDPDDDKVYGFTQANAHKAGGPLPPTRRALLGIGDLAFAKQVSRDFQKNVSKQLTPRRRAPAPTRRE